MTKSNRERFTRQHELAADVDDPAVRDALLEFAVALDPKQPKPRIPKPDGHGGVKEYRQVANGTAYKYLMALRKCHDRGLDLLGADVDTVDSFALNLAVDPDDRLDADLVDWDSSMTEGSAINYQAALRGFYHFCAEPGPADDRPDTAVAFDDVHRITIYDGDDASGQDSDERATQADLDALRDACVHSQNPRRDRAFLELLAGTGQRLHAVVTLRVGDVYLDGSDRLDHPHVLLNPEIQNDGDKGAIDAAGRLRPIVSDTGPIRQWLQHHPLSEPDVRAEHGAPDDFEDCFLFVGSLSQHKTDAADHWGDDSARSTIARRKDKTADLPGVETVTRDVRPKGWRNYAYTRSLDLPIDESVRRKMYGWAQGSDTGETMYDSAHQAEAAEQFVEAWTDEFGDADADSLRAAVSGRIAGSKLPPDVRADLASDEQLIDEIAERVAAQLDG